MRAMHSVAKGRAMGQESSAFAPMNVPADLKRLLDDGRA